VNDDSLTLNNVRLRIVKSKDSLYHMSAAKYANGKDENTALQNIREISYGFNQQDSTIWLDRGFSVQKGTRFRNQAVAIILQVPVGKRILIDRSVARRLNWFHMSMGHNDWEWEDEYNGNDYQYYNDNVEYIMTPGGLERVDKDKKNSEDDNSDVSEAKEKYKQSRDELQKEYEKKQKEAEELKKELETPVDTTRFRYKKSTTSTDITDGLAILSLSKSA
jgi:hypothetical protein